MALSSPTLVALLWVFFGAACGAPTGAGRQDATCGAVKGSSAAFNRVARDVSVEAQKTLHNVGKINSSLVWMEAKDSCDPASLRHKSLPCAGKLLEVLEGYRSAVETVSGFDSCAALASKVKPPLHSLHRELSACVESVGGRTVAEEDVTSLGDGRKPERLHEPLFCRYVMERLFSFSIITARVFAEGDPSGHSGRPPTCQ